MANEMFVPQGNALRMFNRFFQMAEEHEHKTLVLDMKQAFLELPTVEVVHGRWVLAKPRVKGRNATYRCTACGKLRSSYYNDVFQWEYCPCGAKMDGDGNG